MSMLPESCLPVYLWLLLWKNTSLMFTFCPSVHPRRPHSQDLRLLLEPQWTLGHLLRVRGQHHASLADGEYCCRSLTLSLWGYDRCSRFTQVVELNPLMRNILVDKLLTGYTCRYWGLYCPSLLSTCPYMYRTTSCFRHPKRIMQKDVCAGLMYKAGIQSVKAYCGVHVTLSSEQLSCR